MSQIYQNRPNNFLPTTTSRLNPPQNPNISNLQNFYLLLPLTYLILSDSGAALSASICSSISAIMSFSFCQESSVSLIPFCVGLTSPVPFSVYMFLMSILTLFWSLRTVKIYRGVIWCLNSVWLSTS